VLRRALLWFLLISDGQCAVNNSGWAVEKIAGVSDPDCAKKKTIDPDCENSQIIIIIQSCVSLGRTVQGPALTA
jgi:hypothetical protein